MHFNDRDEIIALTPLWKGERLPDGRPKVDEKYLKALKTLTAYTSTSGKKVAYKINKNDYVYFVSLYKSGSKKYVKVKSYKGKYGWIKVSSTRIFDLY